MLADSGSAAARAENPRPAGVRFQDLLAALPAVLAVSAAAVYGVLIVAYSKFYSELGVRANEVGLEFGPGLGGIAGMAILLLFFVVGSAVLTLAYLRVFRGITRLPAAELLHRYRLQVVTLNVTVLFVFWLWVGIQIANVKADLVKDGRPVEPVEFLGLEIFS